MINLIWVMVCTMLVFFMQVGFALLEVGSVQSKNAKSILIKNLLDGSVGSLAWWAFGYGLAYGPNGNVLCGGSWFFFNDASEEVFRGMPDYAHFLFQWAFATTAATIVSGSIAERCNPTSYLIFSGFITAFFYPLAVHWVWSDNAWLAGKKERKNFAWLGFFTILTPSICACRYGVQGFRWLRACSHCRGGQRFDGRHSSWTEDREV